MRKPHSAPVALRFARMDDANALNALFNKVFDANRYLGTWRWKFLREGGSRSLAWTSVADSEASGVVAQYPMLWRRFCFRGENCIAASPVDTAIVPEHRGGLSLIKRLRFLATDKAQMDGAVIAFGFPKPEMRKIGSYLLKYQELATVRPRSVRLNWHGAIQWRLPWLPGVLLNPIGWVLAAARRLVIFKGFRRKKGVDIQRTRDFDGRFDRLWERCRQQFQLAGIRDSRFLQWRFRAMPSCSYDAFVLSTEPGEIDAYAIVKKVSEFGTQVCYLMDFLSIDEPAFDRLARALLGTLSGMGFEHLVYWATPSCYDDILARYGFKDRPGSTSVSIVYSRLGEWLPAEVVCNPRCWFLTYADCDWL